MPPRQDEQSSPRRLGATTAALIVVASMVGTGVFTTTGLLVRSTGSPPAVLIVWLVGGLLALCGALAYGELSAALPRSGGEYQLLSRIYHPAVGFVAGWLSLVVGFSAPIAATSLAFGRYLTAIAPAADPFWAAMILLAVLATLHAAHVTIGGRVQNVLVIAKVTLILFVIVGGFVRGRPERILGESAPALLDTIASAPFAIGLILVSFAYSGWNGAVYLAGEVRRPATTLPLALVSGTTIVILLYLGLNAVFLSAAPAEMLSGVVEISHVATTRLFGEGLGAVLSGVIALALVSSASAMTMTGPRVYQTMGEDYPRLRILSRRTEQGGPLAAIALQTLFAMVMIVTATFEALLTYIGFTLALSAALTVVGVVVLRWREPELTRPYRTWGYPLTPIMFTALSAWMIVHALIERPLIALAGLVTALCGLGLYLLAGPPDRCFTHRDS
ncbi:MAG: amino acid permease [Acidobacteriota bacterium]|nr:MAG: amino acid permease [Acidobacteriota bacterium]